MNPHNFSISYSSPECSAEHCTDPMCPYVHFEGWFIRQRPDLGMFPTKDEADQAIGDLIADDDADRRLHRNRHESAGD